MFPWKFYTSTGSLNNARLLYVTIMILRSFFITGTDTETGKTWATRALMAALQSRGSSVIGMKPVASGCAVTSAGLRHDDALQLQAQSSCQLDYELINPYAFEPPIAPHIAAEAAGISINLKYIAEAHRKLVTRADYVIVEGIGGWRVPLGRESSLVDVVRHLRLHVILVVGLRLGCINHALLSAETIFADGIPFAGWIANAIDPDYAEADKTVQTLSSRISAPLLATLPYLPALDVNVLARRINLDILLGLGTVQNTKNSDRQRLA